jgi:hypothetical protein
MTSGEVKWNTRPNTQWAGCVPCFSKKLGDLWEPLLREKGRVLLSALQ